MDLVTLAKSIGVEGFLHPDELAKLVELAAGKDVIEIGAFCGLSAWGMAITAKHVTSIDHFSAATNGIRHTGEITTLDAYKSAVSRYLNVSHHVATSEEAAAFMAVENIHGPFDFIFIDADHSYEGVRDDIQRWWPKLKPGGVMAWHDYRHNDYPGVEKAVDEIFGPAPEGTTEITLRWVTKPA